MLWLFGEIWLWLVIAFALGALTSWLVLRATQRPKAEPHPVYEPEPEPAPEPAEQTQFIPAAWVHPEPDHPVERHFPDDEHEPEGHREGHLPLPPQRGPQAEDWPTEEEPAWPEAEDATPQWPHQPGRGG
ncbi:hypothetical protein M8542_16230 [Amycolatopsis sp. OK19-0408]|uniref:Uncharacterized protein n=1 Tax=Amycolatopsis iheyensis TaxID=2945988 RepID=A0A9X2SJ38_9PSEU|nr:hypothetical protein [Amycolatopsis iheyensis]MCR6484372.1 hypothetical protein [Amycolatopsis iheyensis]